MSEKYDNWERLVAAVLKRELIWKLCHQESMSTIFSKSSSSSLRFSDANSPAHISLGSYAPEFDIKSIRRLGWGESMTSTLADLQLDVQVLDQLYLAAGTKAVTKKLRNTEKHITKHDFKQQMVVLGNCRHENVGTPCAYYFSKTTKIIVYRHYTQGSVFDLLQASKGMKPKWESRLRIAIGAARGIAHIHKQCGGEMAHGNIKSTNIFLNSQGYGLVSDFGLAAGILKKHGPSQESDVYNFGVVLLEIFTRASPMQKADIDHHLRSFKPYKWNLRGFEHPRLLVDELDMRATLFVDEELIVSAKEKEFRKTLGIAKRCLASSPEARPSMGQVVLELEKMLPPSQLLNQDSIKSGDKNIGWNRF